LTLTVYVSHSLMLWVSVSVCGHVLSVCCCGEISDKEAIDLLDYLDDAGTFDFDSSQQAVKQLQTNFPETFGKETVGISEDNWVVSYGKNADDEIESIRMSVSLDLLDVD